MVDNDYLDYADKLQAERKKRDLIDIKIRKVVETSPPLDFSDEKKRVDHWTNQVMTHIQGLEKKIANCNEVIAQAQSRIQQVTLHQEQVIAFAKNKIEQTKIKEEGIMQLYQSYVNEHTFNKESKSTRPYYELAKAEQDLELKKNHKPKELQKLEIDLEIIDKKIESFKNLLGIRNEELPVDKKIGKKNDTPHPPSEIQDSSSMVKLDANGKRSKKVVPSVPVVDIAVPAVVPKLEDLPVAQPKVAEPQHFSDNFGNNPKLLLSTKRK